MKSRFSKSVLSIFFAFGVALSACDAPANETAGEDAAQAPGVAGDVTQAGSMEEGSPGGEAVTEEEIPTSDVPPPSREVFVTPECEFEEWVGKNVDEEGVKATGRKYRILKPGSMMTMDHNPQRINVEHDDNGIVTRVWCG